MKQLSLEEIKSIELNLLKEFHDVCTKLNLRYSLFAGTLLGAIRHQGFIPWDDDIDVAMPRDDYNKFLTYVLEKNNNVKFSTINCFNNNKFNILFTKIYNPSTKLINIDQHNQEMPFGVFLDIFPYDYLANDFDSSVKLFNKGRLSREILNAKVNSRFSKSRTHAWYFEPIRFVLFVIGKLTNRNLLINKIHKQIIRSEAKYSGNFAGAYREKEILLSSQFEKLIKVKFENLEVLCFKDYDSYLKGTYGDYMKLPPLEKRVTHHPYICYSIE